MRCIICGTDFEYLNWGSPGYPCDCGAEMTKESAQDRLDRYHRARENWSRIQRLEAYLAKRAGRPKSQEAR